MVKEDIGKIIFGASIGFIIGVMVMGFAIASHDHTKEIGQMVCDENHLGEFVKFDSSTKIIKCEPMPEMIPYDGGRIVIGFKEDLKW